MRIVIDLETRSVVDLRKAGVHVYGEHSSTTITHVGYKLDNQPAAIWRPISGSPMPSELLAALSDPTATLVAHNAAGFERVLLIGQPGRRIGVPVDAVVPMSRWTCTAARAAAVGLPRALEQACIVLDLPAKKDMEGRSLMLRCCRPRSTTPSGEPIWWDDDDRMARMDAYCLSDVETEYLLDRRLPPLSPAERQVWEITEHMNTRGVAVDRDLLRRILQLVEQSRIELDGRISKITDGAIPRVSNHTAITRWLNGRGIPVDKGIGKHVLDELLQHEIDDLVRQVLEIRREGGGSSCHKHSAIQRRLPQDGRIRGELVYGGAVSTGRWLAKAPSFKICRAAARLMSRRCCAT